MDFDCVDGSCSADAASMDGARRRCTMAPDFRSQRVSVAPPPELFHRPSGRYRSILSQMRLACMMISSRKSRNALAAPCLCSEPLHTKSRPPYVMT
jgi:hypothetical protein